MSLVDNLRNLCYQHTTDREDTLSCTESNSFTAAGELAVNAPQTPYWAFGLWIEGVILPCPFDFGIAFLVPSAHCLPSILYYVPARLDHIGILT